VPNSTSKKGVLRVSILKTISGLTSELSYTATGIKYFDWEELVPPEIFKSPPPTGFAILFDPRMLITLIRLRERYAKPITCNTWANNGQFRYRGLRPLGVIPKGGAKYSQHFFGRACDLDVAGMTAEEVRQDIKANLNDPAFEFITCIEDKVSWIHFDCRIPLHNGTSWTGIRFVNP